LPGPNANHIDEAANVAKNTMGIAAALVAVYKVLTVPFTAAHRLNVVETNQAIIHKKVDRIDKGVTFIEGQMKGWVESQGKLAPRRRKK